MQMIQTSPSSVLLPETRPAFASGWWVASFGSEGTSGDAKEFGALARGADGRTLGLAGDPADCRPAHAETNSCAVIFDGVLYNRAELLAAVGSVASAANDALLILRAYERWGEEVFHKTKGAFALIIWDSARRTLLCARDPIGTCPLFYAVRDHELLLSVSAEALVKHARVPTAVNRAVIAEHFCQRWLDAEETWLANVKRVLPGHVLRVAESQQTYRYWDPAPPGTEVDWVREEELGHFDDLFDQAVTRFLELGRAGIFLSGGLDSVSVAAVAADVCRRRHAQPLLALSLAFPHPDANEEVIQCQVARTLGLEHLLVPLSDTYGADGLLNAGLALSSQSPMPTLSLWRPGYHYLASEARRRGCQVILTGAGGDEWLAVGPSYAADLLRTFNLAGLYRLTRNLLSSYQVPPHRALRTILWTYGARPIIGSGLRPLLRRTAPDLLRWHRRQRLTQSEPIWIAPDPALRRELNQRVERYVERQMHESDPSSYYLSEVREGLYHPLVAIELEEAFETGRCLGLRKCAPFEDSDMVDFLFRTPPEFLNRGGRSKGLVRESLIRRFPQLGFERLRKVTGAKFYRSVILGEAWGAWQGLGGIRSLAELGIIDGPALRSNVQAIISGARPDRDAWFIWHALNFEAWARPRA